MRPITIAAILSCGLATAAQGSEPDRSTAPDQATNTLYQRVDIQRYPSFVVAGLKVDQQIHYQIDSVFEVSVADAAGNRRATQTIVRAALVKADPLSYAVFTQSLSELRGQRLTYQLNPYSEIVSMEGHQDNTKAVDVSGHESIEHPQGIEPAPTQGLLVTSVIDQDGWRELAQWTLFQPPSGRVAASREVAASRRGQDFVRKTTHDWGELGSWYGKTEFAGRVLNRNTKRFSFKHNLDYIAADDAAAKTVGGLPLKIDEAKFRLYEGWGQIEYDSRSERVSEVREIFHVRGTVATTLLGISSTVKIDERQIFTIKVETE